ncbi:phage I-like protein [Nitrobacter vulgaris]|nr:phage I-like protein [Nitrobacter vulgaris]
MEITTADIAEFVRNFKDKVRRDLPITAGHDNGMNGGELPAIGWFTELEDRGVNGLWAYVEWLEEGKKLLQERAFKYFSPEFYEQYADPETGETRHNVLVGGALTNKPYFKELAPVVAFSEPGIMNQFKEPMDLKDILAKKAEDLSADEKTYLREHKSELDADQQSAFESVLNEAPAGETDEEKAAREAKEAQDKAEADKAAADAAAEAERQASEKNKGGKKILMSEAEVAVLREQADKGAQAFAEVEKMKLDKAVAKMVFSESNKSGRILPKQKDAVASFMLTLSEKQRDQFTNIVSNLPKADASIFSEIGDGGAGDAGDSKSLYKKISDMAKAKVTASEGKTQFSAALLQVYSENPDLKKQYEEALAADAK